MLNFYHLYTLIIKTKRTTILEIGTRWPTLAMASALSFVRNELKESIKKLRRNNDFEVQVIDDGEEYINASRQRFRTDEISVTCLHHRTALVGTYQDRVWTYHKAIPCTSPNLIYIEGPNQFKIDGDVAGWNINHKDLAPMAAGVLRIECLLTIGARIILNGRYSNTRLLKSNLRRRWKYSYSRRTDQHTFKPIETPIGNYNRRHQSFDKQ